MTSALSSLAAGEITEGQLNAYAALLVVSGLIMIGLAATGFGQSSVGARVLNGVLGLGFLGYGAYLLLIFDGGDVWIFFYIFIVPILLIIQAVRHAFGRRRTRTT
jgi:hypothetical protein